jgi:chromosomal replication initiator protein
MADILSHERTQTLVTPRQLAMYISRKYTSKGLQEIAKAFDKKYATIISGVKTIQQRLSNEPSLKTDLEEILSTLGYKLSDSME